MLNLLQEVSGVLALPGQPFGKTDGVSLHISLQPGTNPIYVTTYRLPHSQRQAIQTEVEDMLQLRVIQPSSSTWNSPIFLVPTKNDGYSNFTPQSLRGYYS